MKKPSTIILSLIMATSLLMTVGVLAGENAFADEAEFEVTITNLTRDQQFTPILVATHKAGVRLFTPGDPASTELATLAETGATGPLTGLLIDMGVNPDNVVTSGPLLDPGDSRTVTVNASGGANYVSVAAMLIPTNDAFIALNGVKAPKGSKTLMLYSPAYDAGSEVNDELCSSIPGPDFSECSGPGGGGAPGGGEGYVHIHAGIHGIGDMIASDRDWRNPVAKITIRRIKNDDDD